MISPFTSLPISRFLLNVTFYSSSFLFFFLSFFLLTFFFFFGMNVSPLVFCPASSHHHHLHSFSSSSPLPPPPSSSSRNNLDYLKARRLPAPAPPSPPRRGQPSPLHTGAGRAVRRREAKERLESRVVSFGWNRRGSRGGGWRWQESNGKWIKVE